MPRSTAVTILAAWLVVASACGGSTPANPSANVATGSGRTPLQVKVMTFNIQHGIDGTSRYNLQRAIDTIAPARLAAGLRAATGQPWEVAYEQEWFTPDVSCQNSGRGDGRETEGLAFVTR